MDIYSIANCLTGFIEAYFLLTLCETFMEHRNWYNKYIYCIGLIVTGLLINLSNFLFSITILNMVIVISCEFIISFLYKGKMKLHIMSAILTFTLTIITEVFILSCLSVIFNISADKIIANGSFRLYGIILSKTLGFIVVQYFHFKFKREIMKYDINYWLLFVIMFGVTTLTMYTFCKMLEEVVSIYVRNLAVLSSLGLSIATIIVLFLYENTLKQKSLLSKQQMSEVQLKEQVKHYNDIMMTQGQVKKIRHDLKNHLLSIMAMIKSNDSEKCINYIKSLLENVDISNSYIDTGNIVLDAIISAKITEAEKKGIEFNSEIQIPSNLPISQEDECVIFGNALDNAIEAAIKVKDKKYINLSLIFNKDTLTCKISNSYDGNSNLITTKSDIRNHGLGKENIKKALEKYNSIARVIEENNEYILTFVLMGLKIN